MGENESLDLSQPGGQTWNNDLYAVWRRDSAQDISRQIERTLRLTIGKAPIELAGYGPSQEAVNHASA